MSKYRIHLKQDPIFDVDSLGNSFLKQESLEKDVEIIAESPCEACNAATKHNHPFYFTSWQCIQQDKPTPEQIAEAKKNQKFLEEYEKRQKTND